MFIHRALNSISAKPAIVLAPILILVVLAGYYWNVKRECEGEAALRHDLLEALKSVTPSGQIRLSEIYPDSWDFAKAYTNFEPQHRKRSCPMGWSWSDQERQEIISAGRLGVIIFFNDGTISRILEFDNAAISIEENEKPVTRETAIFTVEARATPDNPGFHYSLRVQNQPAD